MFEFGGEVIRAAIYNEQKNILLTELETPKVGDNDFVVSDLYASICGTDVAVCQHGPHTGHRVNVGGEFGHEMGSEVVQVGKNVRDIRVGDRVYSCPRLAKGDPKRAGTVDGFSEYGRIPNAELGKQVYAVPDAISSKEACLIEPFTVGCRVARRSFPHGGEKAIVFGMGAIAELPPPFSMSLCGQNRGTRPGKGTGKKKQVRIDLYFIYVGPIRIPLKMGKKPLNELEPA